MQIKKVQTCTCLLVFLSVPQMKGRVRGSEKPDKLIRQPITKIPKLAGHKVCGELRI